MAVAWLRQRDRRVIPILGARKPEQFQDVLGSLEVGLAAEHVARAGRRDVTPDGPGALF